jgi:hypothetical protein
MSALVAMDGAAGLDTIGQTGADLNPLVADDGIWVSPASCPLLAQWQLVDGSAYLPANCKEKLPAVWLDSIVSTSSTASSADRKGLTDETSFSAVAAA